MFIVGFPWLDRRTDTVEWGVACNGCRHKGRGVVVGENKKGPRLDRVLYSKHDFLDHLADCEEAAKLFVREHAKFSGDENVRDERERYCRVTEGSRDQMTDEVTSNDSGCFLWHGKDQYGKVW